MMQQGLRAAGNRFETIVSALVILVALVFMDFMYAQIGTHHLGSYSLVLRMRSAAGLDIGKDVRVGGVKVGSISRLSLDPRDYSAMVEVNVRDDLFLPADSITAVTSTPLGEVYLVINPGHSVRTVPPGGTLLRPPAKPMASVADT